MRKLWEKVLEIKRTLTIQWILMKSKDGENLQFSEAKENLQYSAFEQTNGEVRRTISWALCGKGTASFSAYLQGVKLMSSLKKVTFVGKPWNIL